MDDKYSASNPLSSFKKILTLILTLMTKKTRQAAKRHSAGLKIL